MPAGVAGRFGATGPVRLAVALLCACALAGCARRVPGGLLPEVERFTGVEIAEVEFLGDLVIPEDSLRAAVVTRASSCRILFLPICPLGLGRTERALDPRELARDLIRIQIVHRNFGYYGARVVPEVEPVSEEEDAVVVRFVVRPGDRVVVTELDVLGAEEILPPALSERLPLTVGEPFGRDEFVASADTLLRFLRSRGYVYADVLRNYAIDTIADVATVEFAALPGPLVTIDTIVVLGTGWLDQRLIRRQVALREGEVLTLADLNRGQRALYELPMIGFASVQLAPDSLQVDPDLAQATVVVRIVESARYRAGISGGIGTVDCARVSASVLDRNFLGGARTARLSAEASRIGVGEPLDVGYSGFPCSTAAEDPFSDTLNYRIAFDLVQPRVLGTRTSATLDLFAERLSEAGAFARSAVGGEASLVRQLGRQTGGTVTLHVARGQTVADDLFFCASLDVCARAAIDSLRAERWSNWLALAVSRDRLPVEIFPWRGYTARASVEWASPVLASDDRYLRLFGDAAVYRRLARDWVLAGRLLAGSFVAGSDGFIPPERRFFAGGPNTVRGFPRNALGPTLFAADELVVETDTLAGGEVVTDTTFFFEGRRGPHRVGVGGTAAMVASLELTSTLPVLRGGLWESLRWAAFVDAGRVWADVEGYQPFWAVTPGLGLRIVTPIGPVRVDVAYRDRELIRSDLFVFDPISGKLRKRLPFTPEPEGWFDRLQLYVAVGRAF